MGTILLRLHHLPDFRESQIHPRPKPTQIAAHGLIRKGIVLLLSIINLLNPPAYTAHIHPSIVEQHHVKNSRTKRRNRAAGE